MRDFSLCARVLLATIVAHGELDTLTLLALVPAADLSAWLECLHELLAVQWVVRVPARRAYLYRASAEGKVFIQGHSLRAGHAA